VGGNFELRSPSTVTNSIGSAQDEIWDVWLQARSKSVSHPYWVGNDHVVENVLTVFGLRRQHIIRKHGKPDLEMWVKASPANAHFWAFEDKQGDWHLIIAWKEAVSE
jgi:hypothetical protein